MKTTIPFYYLCFGILSVLFIGLSSCGEHAPKNIDCSKFIEEKYLSENIDSQIIKEATEYRDYLLKKFDDTSIDGVDYEAYHLQFYSSHGFGRTVKFEKKPGDYYYLSTKCITKEGWFPDCENYHIGLEKEEWEVFEKMIYDFNFWTAEKFKSNKGVLDGHVFLLEGRRPAAKKCHKRTYQIIGRGSPEFDKIGALCEYILDYEDRLAFKYGKRDR